ncbi:MAG TPA: DUF779 domain-containing protein [Nevskiaceae bacterium]|nr:DUF779 domain-containing protein [Nevskiaceae bacterium]
MPGINTSNRVTGNLPTTRVRHQSDGCCDGSAPMCCPQDEFMTGGRDVQFGEIADAPLGMSSSQHECWKRTQLAIDTVPGMGGMFPLENGEGVLSHRARGGSMAWRSSRR